MYLEKVSSKVSFQAKDNENILQVNGTILSFSSGSFSHHQLFNKVTT